MGALTDFRSDIRAWTNSQTATDAQLNRFIRMAEERLDADLRVKEQIERQRADLQDNRIPLPNGWMETIYVRFFPKLDNSNLNIKNGRPLTYVTPEKYWSLYKDNSYNGQQDPKYTVIGESLFVAPQAATDGTTIEMGFHRKIVTLTDSDQGNWLYVNYYRLFLSATLAVAFEFLFDDRSMKFEASTADLIARYNEQYKISVVSGNTPREPSRTFG